MIILHCPNCGFPILPSAMVKDDVTSATASCKQKFCGAVYRITIISLHEGKPIDPELKAHYGETYDAVGNRVPLNSSHRNETKQAKLRSEDAQAGDAAD